MAKTSVGPILSHWSTLLEEFHTSALDFYARVEQALARREIPDMRTSRVEYKESGVLSAQREYLRVERGEHVFDLCAAPFGRAYFFSSWLTEKRPGLLAALGFVALYGVVLLFAMIIIGVFFNIIGLDGLTGAILNIFVLVAAAPFLFILLAEQIGPEAVATLPIIGPLYVWIFLPATYYKLDTAAMFQKLVHNAVLEAIDELTTTHGLRTLSEAERKPVMRGLLAP